MKAKKFLAFAVSLFMLLAAIGPVNVQAASSKLKLSKVKRTIYVDGCKVKKGYTKGKYTLKLKNLPSKYSVEWISSNTSVAKVKNKNSAKTTITAVAPGTCTVKAKVIDQTTKPQTLHELTCKVTIKKDCAAVQIMSDSKNIDTLSLQPGESKQLSATMYNDGAKALTPGKDVTDTIFWVSDNPTLVSVDSKTGLVKAGSAAATGVKITCYAAPDKSGTYADISKAVATDVITVNVASLNNGMTKVVQTALDTIQVTFAANVSAKLTKDNFLLVYGSSMLSAKTVTFDASGTVATVQFMSELTRGVAYNVVLNNSGINGTTSMTFTSAKGTPARIELYTSMGDNKAVVLQPVQIYFKLYDVTGIDITPTNTDSAEYKTYASKFTWKAAESTSENGYTLDAAGKLTINTLNKTVTVVATYSDGTVTCNGLIKVLAVSAASTLTYIDATIADTSLTGDKLSWDKTVKGLSISDNGSYRLVAKVKDGSGKFIYSTDAGSNIVFGLADASGTNHKIFIEDNGHIWPLKEGTENVNVYLKAGTTLDKIGTVTVSIGASRIPAKIGILVDGLAASGDTFKRTDSVWTTNPVLSVAVYDNYGGIFNNTKITDFSVTTTAKNQYGYVTKVNADGTAELAFYGNGTAEGTQVYFTINYTYLNQGKAEKISKEICLIIYTPDPKATPTYTVAVDGTTDLTIKDVKDLNKSVQIKLIDTRNGIRYKEIALTTREAALAGYGYYFTLTKAGPGGDVQITDHVNASSIDLVTVKDKQITKMDAGVYTIHVYLKNLSVNDTEVAVATLNVTDSQDGAVLKRLPVEKTTIKFTTASTVAEMNQALLQCYSVTINGVTAAMEVVDAMPMNGAVYFRTIKATGTINVGGTSYTVTYPITLEELIMSAS